MKINDIDELFKLMERVMNNQQTGAYTRKDKNPEFSEEDEEEDEPIDITEDKKYIYITVELRGVGEDDFNVLVEPYSIILEVFVDGQWFSDKFSLPHKVKRKAKIEFNNCILDVILTKDKEKNGKKSIGRKNSDNRRESHPEIV
jgi:HSP20 family molecular chaperone IbpA